MESAKNLAQGFEDNDQVYAVRRKVCKTCYRKRAIKYYSYCAKCLEKKNNDHIIVSHFRRMAAQAKVRETKICLCMACVQANSGRSFECWMCGGRKTSIFSVDSGRHYAWLCIDNEVCRKEVEYNVVNEPWLWY